MSEEQIFAWLAFVLAAMFTGFMSGYYIGYDRAMGIKKLDPSNYNWYQWSAVKVRLDDHINDYELARIVNDWLTKNVNDRDFKVYVHDDPTLTADPFVVFYIKDKNIALTLSIKHNITYMKGFNR
jgi:hypothetical protein